MILTGLARREDGRKKEGEMDPSACHINILLASDLINIKKPIYTFRHVMLVNCTKKKKKSKGMQY